MQIGFAAMFSAGPMNVRAFGALGDGKTDDTARIQAAIDACASSAAPVTLRFPDGNYRITTTIVCDNGRANLSFDAGACLVYAGPADRPALVIGGESLYDNAVFDGLAVVATTAHGYDSESFVGVRIARMSRSYLRIRRIQGFTVNLQLWGSHTDGVGYNTFMLGSLLLGKVHLDIASRVPEGWINENLFVGGRYGNASDFPAGVPSYGVRFRAEQGAYRNNNNNVWVKPCFELIDGNAGVDRIPIRIEDAARLNVFENIRVETGTGPVLYAKGDHSALGNRVSIAYFGAERVSLLPVEIGSAAYGNEITTLSQIVPHNRATWHSGDLPSKALRVSALEIAVPGCFLASSSSSAISYSMAGPALADCVSLTGSQGIGVVVDTTQYKTLIVQTNTLRGLTGRIGVVCLNAAGAVLADGAAQGTDASGIAAFGYICRVGVDGVNRAVFRVRDDVASARVIVAGGTRPCDLVAFSVTGVGAALDLHAFSVRSGVSAPQR